jgi:hypothetical protein
LAAEPPVQISQVFIGQLGAMDFRLVGGRIVAMCDDPTRSVSLKQGSAARKETLNISFNGNMVTMRYELSLADAHIDYIVLKGHEVTIRRTRRGDGKNTAYDIVQPADGPIRLHIDNGAEPADLTGASLWHLLLSLPELREDLAGLIEMVHPTWRLSKACAVVESNLLRTTVVAPVFDRKDVSIWIEQLASPRFADRRSGERKLREAGPAIFPVLRQFDRQRLDSEQRFRLRKILHATATDDNEDSVETVVTQLALDPTVWLSLLGRDDMSVRRTAAEHLAQLLGAPIAFDVEADEATRREQIKGVEAQVRQSLELDRRP